MRWGLALLLVLSLAGCANDADQPETLTVLAAASLRESFEELGRDFEREHDVRVEFNFGPSSGLAQQINAGAPGDVFASASVRTMDQVEQADAAQVIARNTMVIAVPVGNPARIERLEDLAGPGVDVALCQAQVPCGTVAAQVLDNAGVELTPVSEETDVRAVLTKVGLDEVDAGIVYVTDVRAAGDAVTGVPIPAEVNAGTDYPIVALDDNGLARAWVDLVLSDEGRHVLQDHGFDGP